MRKPGDVCRAAADRLQARIDAKRDPAIAHQNLTARRSRIAAGMAREAEHLEGVQRVLRFVAEMHDRCPQGFPWRRMTSAAAAERVIRWGRPERGLPAPDGWCADDRAKLARLGITTDEALAWTWATIRAAYEERRPPTREERLRELERDLIGVRFPGFFPTPASLADRVCEAAGLQDGHHVLEPSAGKGDLVEAALRAAPGCKVEAVELASRLADLLRVRFADRPAVTVHGADFLEWSVARPQVDRVVMNPPFEGYIDRRHVLRALRFLRPGGRLVSIMGAGALTMRGADEFRSALDDLCGSWEVEELPEGSFTGAEAFRQTGVRALLLVAEVR